MQLLVDVVLLVVHGLVVFVVGIFHFSVSCCWADDQALGAIIMTAPADDDCFPLLALLFFL